MEWREVDEAKLQHYLKKGTKMQKLRAAMEIERRKNPNPKTKH
jgi:hypothetical protein